MCYRDIPLWMAGLRNGSCLPFAFWFHPAIAVLLSGLRSQIHRGSEKRNNAVSLSIMSVWTVGIGCLGAKFVVYRTYRARCHSAEPCPTPILFCDIARCRREEAPNGRGGIGPSESPRHATRDNLSEKRMELEACSVRGSRLSNTIHGIPIAIDCGDVLR